MKKSTKWVCLILAVLTVAGVALSVVMLKAVSGDGLLLLDSRTGSVYAASYRWVCIASAVLILIWILLAVKNRKAISSAIASKMRRKERNPKDADAAPPVAPAEVSPPAAHSEMRTCGKCAREMPAGSKFCPFCGESIKPF